MGRSITNAPATAIHRERRTTPRWAVRWSVGSSRSSGAVVRHSDYSTALGLGRPLSDGEPQATIAALRSPILVAGNRDHGRRGVGSDLGGVGSLDAQAAECVAVIEAACAEVPQASATVRKLHDALHIAASMRDRRGRAGGLDVLGADHDAARVDRRPPRRQAGVVARWALDRVLARPARQPAPTTRRRRSRACAHAAAW